MEAGRNRSQSEMVEGEEPPAKRPRRKRIQLNCGECRQKKLSCDRNLPCSRCVRTGRSHLCSFESGATGNDHAASGPDSHQTGVSDSTEVLKLRAEVARLTKELAVTSPPSYPERRLQDHDDAEKDVISDISDPRDRQLREYYSRHRIFQSMFDVPQLFSFARDVTIEHLKPVGVNLKKFKSTARANKTSSATTLHALLPTKDDVDILVNAHLQSFAYLHRVLHIPTFKREYANFWSIPEEQRPSSIAALILSMSSISVFIINNDSSEAAVASQYRPVSEFWITACDEWLRQQSLKHRKLIYYQVMILNYFAKRMHMIGKKRYWMETGSMIQNAVMDGLHTRRPGDSVFTQEMKSRIWAVLRELDLGNTFAFGLPSILYNVRSDREPPSHLNDDEFDETCVKLPTSRPSSEYTEGSYQYWTAQTWNLRVEISRQLCSPGNCPPMAYEEALRYTHELTQAIYALQAWERKTQAVKSASTQLLVHAILQLQLKDCIIALHRPFVAQEGQFRFSEDIIHNMSKDILAIHYKLAQASVQPLAVFRVDLIHASLNLTRFTISDILRSNVSSNNTPDSNIELMEQCLPLIEDRYLRCCRGEPWCPVIVSAAIELLKIHAGKKSIQEGKRSCGKRFLELHDRCKKERQRLLGDDSVPSNDVSVDSVINVLIVNFLIDDKKQSGREYSQLPTPATGFTSSSQWLGQDLFDFDFSILDTNFANGENWWESI